MDNTGTQQRLVLVTGPGGAGRATAIRALEDMGWEAIDNIPLSLVPRLLDGPPLEMPLALGIDARNREFNIGALIDLLDELHANAKARVELLYLDARHDVLLRRYSETRRRHPLAPDEEPEIGIAREADLMGQIRGRADVLIDTSDLTPHDLKGEIARWYAPTAEPRLTVSVLSFSYKRGVPRGVDMLFDCRFLRNPYWTPALRPLNGRDPDVADHIAQDDRLDPFMAKVDDICSFLLPAYVEEGKAHFSIGFGCTGGQHRSVMIAEKLGASLAHKGWQVSIRHREQERWAHTAPAAIDTGDGKA